MPQDSSRFILPEPPDDLKRHSDRLRSRIAGEIGSGGPMPFSRYMEMALYEPGLGYYSAGLRKFGAEGDFVTAPELGPVFAQCLARQVRQVAEALGNYEILEIGAGTGRLAADLLRALPSGSRPVRYRILERSADLRLRQQEALAGPARHTGIEWLDSPPESPWQGVIIANEVIDALPVELFVIAGGRVLHRHVAASGPGFEWSDISDPQFEWKVRRVLPAPFDSFPDGYHSEFCPLLPSWLDSVSSTMERGCALFVDYGYPRRDYYSPERRTGTLVCHYRHRGHDDPFAWPGLQDISAFVDFTAVAEAADHCGLEVAGHTSQSMFLFDCGLETLMQGMSEMPDRERLAMAAEVRELTLPGAMGEKFHVMALSRGLDIELRGFRSHDARHRL